MPNWAYNQLICRTDADFERVKAALLDDEGKVDFNRLVPQPELIRKRSFLFGDEFAAIARYIDPEHPVDEEAVRAKARELYPNIAFVEEIPPSLMLDRQSDDPEYPALTDDRIAKVVEASQDRNEVAKLAESWDVFSRQDNFPEHYTTLENFCEQAFRALILYGFPDWYSWSTALWGTKWNARDTYVFEEKKSIVFDTAWAPVPPLMGYLSEQLGVALYMRYTEEQFSACAGELVFDSGNLVECNEPEDALGIFKIASLMNDSEQQCYRYWPEEGEIIFAGWCESAEEARAAAAKGEGTEGEADENEWLLSLPKFEDLPVIDTTSQIFERFLAGSGEGADEQGASAGETRV